MSTYKVLYKCWEAIKQRCYNPNCSAYPNYGGRGITMDPVWLNDSRGFIHWAFNNGYKPGLTIERIDVNLGYSPSNCTWANRQIQAANRRVTGNIPYHGVHLRVQTKRLPKYIASITYQGKKVQIGSFESAIEAAKARDKYIITNSLKGYPLNFS